MKKQHKRMLTLITVGALTLAACMQTYAAGWKQNHIGWWWQEDNGTYPANSWRLLNGQWYYFYGNGYMAANTWIGNYYVGSDGGMLSNTRTPDGYLVGADGAWIPEVDEAVIRRQYEQIVQRVKREVADDGDDGSKFNSWEIEDINGDGVPELCIEETRWYNRENIRVWVWKNNTATELEVPVRGNASWREGNLFGSDTIGHSSGSFGCYYRLNVRGEFEFVIGWSFTTGVHNGIGRDAWYEDDAEGNHIREITEDELDAKMAELGI